jgi:uncharacterized membrane protein
MRVLTNRGFVAILTPIMTRHRHIQVSLLVLVALWCAGFILVPMLEHLGTDVTVVRQFYGTVCHQMEARSHMVAGHPMAVCVRCSAIYIGFLLGVGASMFFGRSFSLPWVRIGVLAVAAMLALDVLMDLLGVLSNTILSRTVSGGMFGLALSLLTVPLFIEAMETILKMHNLPSEGVPHDVG